MHRRLRATLSCCPSATRLVSPSAQHGSQPSLQHPCCSHPLHPLPSLATFHHSTTIGTTVNMRFSFPLVPQGAWRRASAHRLFDVHARILCPLCLVRLAPHHPAAAARREGRVFPLAVFAQRPHGLRTVDGHGRPLHKRRSKAALWVAGCWCHARWVIAQNKHHDVCACVHCVHVPRHNTVHRPAPWLCDRDGLLVARHACPGPHPRPSVYAAHAPVCGLLCMCRLDAVAAPGSQS